MAHPTVDGKFTEDWKIILDADPFLARAQALARKGALSYQFWRASVCETWRERRCGKRTRLPGTAKAAQGF
jgi:hypothetical protein